jgi:hypothetical protein
MSSVFSDIYIGKYLYIDRFTLSLCQKQRIQAKSQCGSESGSMNLAYCVQQSASVKDFSYILSCIKMISFVTLRVFVFF